MLLGLLLLLPLSSPAAPPPLKHDDAALAQQLRGIILDFLPDPLYEDSKKWGKQKAGPRGNLRNDGRWLRYKITGRDLPQTLKLQIGEVTKEAALTRFRVIIDFDANVLLERQTWKLGARLYSGSTRARFHARLVMHCELTSKVEKAKGWIPDVVLRLRVVKSEFQHDKVVVEHTAGVGGDAAKILGELMIETVKLARPDLEKRLADKMNAAILKAGDTKEVRVNLSDLLAGKKPIAAPKKP